MNRTLKAAMMETGHTADTLAAHVGVDPKTAARWVNPGRVPQPRHRARVAELLGRDVQDLWPDVLRRRDPKWLREWLEYERESRLLRWFEPALVPGLLQTEAYARAVLGWGGLMPADDVDARTASRIERQSILDGARPPQVFVMIDESVIRRCVGGPAVMAEQCRHLAEMAARPHVHIQVIPTTAGGHAGLAGGFILARGVFGHAAHLDDRLRAHVTIIADDIDRLEATWEALRAVALPTDQSVQLITEAVETWQSI